MGKEWSVLFEIHFRVAVDCIVEIKYLEGSEQQSMESQHVKGQSLLFFLLTKLRICYLLLFGILVLPKFCKSLGSDELSLFDSTLNIVEGAVAILDLFVKLRKFPGKGLAMLPGYVLSSELIEDLTEFLELLLILSGVELKGTFHDSTIVKIGNVDDMCFSGVFWAFLVSVASQVGEESDDDSHSIVCV